MKTRIGISVILFLVMPFSLSLFAEEGEVIKVMSFNIRYNNPDDGSDAWPHRKEQVVSVIRFHNADLIGLQEAQADQLEYLEQALPEYKWCGEGRLAGGEGEEFCAIFYKKEKFDLVNAETFWLSETPSVKVSKSWDSALPRVCTRAEFRMRSSGRTFSFFNTHFDHRGELAREESAKLIAERITGAEKKSVILAGDFNCESESRPFLILSKLLKEASSISKIPSHGPRWTFHAFTGCSGKNKLIDFIFVNKQVVVLRHANLVDNLNGRFPSDHLPVLAEIFFSE